MRKMTWKRGDDVWVHNFLPHGEDFWYPGTVVRVGKVKLQVLFPVRKFTWVPMGLCRKTKPQ